MWQFHFGKRGCIAKVTRIVRVLVSDDAGNVSQPTRTKALDISDLPTCAPTGGFLG